MLISELIRLGRMLRPQCRGFLFVGDKSCTIGAVLEAAGYGSTPEEIAYHRGAFNWRALLATNAAEYRTVGEIAKLNDRGMSSEDIANWLVASGLDFDVKVNARLPENATTCAVEAPAGGRKEKLHETETTMSRV